MSKYHLIWSVNTANGSKDLENTLNMLQGQGHEIIDIFDNRTKDNLYTIISTFIEDEV